jgi:tetratricopeptide (TPR) repeat protein
VPSPQASAAASPQPDPLTQAHALYAFRKFHEAIAVLDGYLRTAPTDAAAIVLRGDAKSDLNDNQAALADYNLAIRIAPEYAYAYQTRCETRDDLGDDSGALEDCNMAIRLDPSVGESYVDRADIYLDEDAYPEALADLNQAEKLGDHDAFLYASRCEAKQLLHDFPGATADCERALVIDPANRRGLWQSGLLAIRTARYTDAIATFNEYALKYPDYAVYACMWRGVAYNRLGQFQLALDDLNRYVAAHGDSALGRLERGVARANLGDRFYATVDVAEAVRLYKVAGNTASANAAGPYLDALNTNAALPAIPSPF